MRSGDFVRVKDDHAFDIARSKHYGEVIDTNINVFGQKEIHLKTDMCNTHDSTFWIEEEYYEKIK